MSQIVAQQVAFAPRRVGHANLFVGDLERSLTFYNQVCGLEEVRREPGIGGGFLSNGNTHHDIGLIQVSAQARVGMQGHVQIPEGRGSRPGLNHFGWEMETEGQLVEAYRRARAARVPIHRTTDHQISHSVYVFDPEQNLNEFYVDVLEDWRTIFNPTREDLISGPWDPDAQRASGERRHAPRPEVRRVAGAAFHPIRITHAVLVARDFAALRGFYTEVAGLRPVHESVEGGFVCLRGTASEYDLVLFRADRDLSPGFHHMAFEVPDEDDLDQGEAALRRLGVQPLASIANPVKRAVLFRDPDGLVIEMYVLRARDRASVLADAAGVRRQPYLV